MTANSNSNSENMSYDMTQNTVVDSTRGNLLTDVQMSADSVPMVSTTTNMALNDVTSHEITSILERPVNLGTFTWSSTDQALSTQLLPSDYDAGTANYLQYWDFPQAIFEKSPNVVDKLSRYQYFKADVEIEIKINAQPFLQGALMLVYNPYYNVTGDFRRKGTRFLASQTSCPYKIVSLEEGNSLKITCPYANIYDLFDLENSSNQFGTVFLYVFSNLSGAVGDETVKYTVFARFINPQFYVPTHKSTMSAIRDQHDIDRLRAKGYSVAQSDTAPEAAPDSGESDTPGPVSKIAKGVTMISDVLSDVPVIGSIASTVSWVSRIIGKTAAAFGWSKPISIQPKMNIKPNSSLIHTEGTDDGTTLALLQDNGIDGSSMIPEIKDEMALNHIFSRPNYFHRKIVTSAEFSNRQLLTKFEVSPFSEYQYGLDEDPETLFLGSFAYGSMVAGTLWRGTINYDIMVVKTPFHQGRFAVVFFPETNLADVPTNLDDTNNLLNTNYNVVCNLKDRQDEFGRTTFRVSVPFISNVPWRETYTRENNAPNAKTLDTKTGCLGIYSLVDLSSPPTVASSVTFVVAHSGGEDYQVARPILNLSPGYQTRYAQTDVGPFISPVDENLLVPSHRTCDVTAQTTGEYFVSFRSLIKRFGHYINLKPSEDYSGIRTRAFQEEPFSGNRVLVPGSNVARALPTPWYMVSFLYRFYNGSSNTKIIPFSASAICSSFLSFDEDLTGYREIPKEESYGQPVFIQNQQVSAAYEIRTPYYRGIRCDVINPISKPILGDVRTNIKIENFGYGGNTQISRVYEAAGDDFSFFFQIGPPPMMDIRNVLSIAELPLTPLTVNVDVAWTVSQPFNIVQDYPLPGFCAYQMPLLDPLIVNDGILHQILTSNKSSFLIEYTDGDVTSVNVTDCFLYRAPSRTPMFVFRKIPNKDLDLLISSDNLRQTLSQFVVTVFADVDSTPLKYFAIQTYKYTNVLVTADTPTNTTVSGGNILPATTNAINRPPLEASQQPANLTNRLQLSDGSGNILFLVPPGDVDTIDSSTNTVKYTHDTFTVDPAASKFLLEQNVFDYFVGTN